MSDSVFGQPSRRSFIKIGGLAIGGLALAACAPAASTGSSAGTGSGDAAKLGVGNNGQVGKGRSGAIADTLFIAGFQWGAPATFNPLSPTAAWPAAANVMQITYETLLRWNIATGELMPGLAKEYKVDGTKTVTCVLQDGVTFSDGSALTAADVVANFELGKKNTGISRNAFWQAADTVTASDDKTVVIGGQPEDQERRQPAPSAHRDLHPADGRLRQDRRRQAAHRDHGQADRYRPLHADQGRPDPGRAGPQRELLGQDLLRWPPGHQADHPPDLQVQRRRQHQVPGRRAGHHAAVRLPDLEDVGGRQAGRHLPQGEAVLPARQHAHAVDEHHQEGPRQGCRAQGDRFGHRLRRRSQRPPCRATPQRCRPA